MNNSSQGLRRGFNKSDFDTKQLPLGSTGLDLAYEADLLGNIQQALAGLQGFDVMALELKRLCCSVIRR